MEENFAGGKFRGRKISREENFAGGKFREIPLAVDIIFAGGKFRAKSKFAKIAKLNSTRKIGVRYTVHVADVKKRTLPPFESIYIESFWIMSSQRSRRRDKKKLSALFKQQHYSMANAHKHTLFDEAATTSITTALKRVNLSLLATRMATIFWKIKGGCNPRNPPPHWIRQWVALPRTGHVYRDFKKHCQKVK